MSGHSSRFLLGSRRCVHLRGPFNRDWLSASLAAAERRELYRFSADLGKLALHLADQYGSNHEKWSANCFVQWHEVLKSSLLADHYCCSLRWSQVTTVYTYARTLLDSKRHWNTDRARVIGNSFTWAVFGLLIRFHRIYSSFSSMHLIKCRLFICDHRKCLLLLLMLTMLMSIVHPPLRYAVCSHWAGSL